MDESMITNRSDRSKASLELLYHISRELASDLDLQVVLRRVLLLSMEAVGSISGSLIVLDSQGDPVQSAIIHSGQIYSEDTKPLNQILAKGLAGWVANHKKVAIIPDTNTDSRWMKRPDDLPEHSGSKSAISAPLMVRDELVGVMTLVHSEINTFSEEHGNLLKTIADQAGITVLNARLYDESRRRERAMTALAESAMAITASVGMEDILHQILMQVQRALGVEAVSLSLVEPDQATLVVRAVSGIISEKFLQKKTSISDSVCGVVIKTGQHLIVTDTATDERYNPEVEKYIGFRPKAIACVPIHAPGEIIGALEIYNPRNGGFNNDDLIVLSGIGNMAGSVIRYGQLFDRLEGAHKRFRELFDDSIDMILITDHQGNIRQYNRQAEAVLRHVENHETEINIFEIQRFHRFEDLDDLLYRLKEEGTISYEDEVETTAGKKWVQIYLRQIQLEDEDLLQWILHDISERKDMDTLREDLISMIYHDLRSPLANVMYSLEMIESMMPADKSEDFNMMIDVATRATERIQRLTNSLLDIRLLEAGQPVSNLDQVPANEILNFAFNAIKPVAATKNQSLDIHGQDLEATVLADKDMISRVLINLLDNAIKYTPIDGKISAGIQMVNENVAFWVEDNGPGIPEDKRQSIFNKFSRLGNTGLGFGLGLAFCRLAVEAHNGTILVEEKEGTGSRFVFQLPKQEGGSNDSRLIHTSEAEN